MPQQTRQEFLAELKRIVARIEADLLKADDETHRQLAPLMSKAAQVLTELQADCQRTPGLFLDWEG